VYVSLYAFILKDVSTGFDKLVERHGLAVGQTVVRVDVLETKAMEARMTVVKADEIQETIENTGRIAIYGVYFDTDKAVLKPDSAESLAEMAKAIKENGGRYLIVGHTDSQGDYSHNQTLSQKRAAAVTAALVGQHGVPSDSVVPVGVGMAAPVAPNSDDDGRAKNRRVEMVKM
jgi:outer membrane protein OmpA-like peptidoglycan-associated protein